MALSTNEDACTRELSRETLNKLLASFRAHITLAGNPLKRSFLGHVPTILSGLSSWMPADETAICQQGSDKSLKNSTQHVYIYTAPNNTRISQFCIYVIFGQCGTKFEKKNYRSKVQWIDVGGRSETFQLTRPRGVHKSNAASFGKNVNVSESAYIWVIQKST